MPEDDGRLENLGSAREKHAAPLWLAAPLPPVGRRRTRALSDLLRARALFLGLRSQLTLEEAAAALASQANGNQTALRRALRDLSLGGDASRSPAVRWAARALRLAVAHARWLAYDEAVREPTLRSYRVRPARGADLLVIAGRRDHRSGGSTVPWGPDREPAEPA